MKIFDFLVRELKLEFWKKNSAVYHIDVAGLYILGSLSLGFLLYYRTFAKSLYVYIPFLGTPLFIGDMAFVTCFVLFFAKWMIISKKVNDFALVFIMYFLFVLIKILTGFLHGWGALTLRHSVLFLYPLFAVFAYSFYRSDFFSLRRRIVYASIFIIVFVFLKFHARYALTCLALMLVLLNVNPISRRLSFKLLWGALLFLFFLKFPFPSVFNIARTFIIGNVLVFLYVGFCLLRILKAERKLKIFLLILLFIIIGFGLTKFSRRGELKSLVDKHMLFKRFDQKVKLVREYENDFVKPDLQVKLYNEDREMLNGDNVKVPFTPLISGCNKETEDKSLKPNEEEEPVALKLNPEGDAFLSEEYASIPPKEEAVPAPKQERLEAVPVEIEKPGPASIGSKKKSFIDPVFEDSRDIEVSYANTLFRIFIWKDALEEIRNSSSSEFIAGYDFGKPLRSHSLEVLGWAISEWKRDGWISMHNSYIDLIYRAGLIGLLMIATIIILIAFFTIASIRNRSLNGILLTGALISWFIPAFFLDILQMPYSAIPLWGLFGLTGAYLFKKKTI